MEEELTEEECKKRKICAECFVDLIQNEDEKNNEYQCPNCFRNYYISNEGDV